MYLDSIALCLLLAGIMLLLYSLKPALSLGRAAEQLWSWRILTSLIVLFIFGYSFYLWHLLNTEIRLTEISVSLILFGGSCFVTLIIRMSEKSILLSRHIAALERHNALHDQLTGLANRQMLHNKLNLAISEAAAAGTQITVLLMDIDRFKEINDTLGHHVGDRVLQQVAPKLLSAVRESDTVARLGGDEFAIVLPGTGKADAENFAQRIFSNLNHYILIQQHRLKINMSIGICTYPEHGIDVDTLLQHADVSMYIAKQKGTGFAFYNPKQDKYSLNRLKLSQALELAIRDGDIELYYQPIMKLSDHSLKGFEALSRWKNNKNEFISPADFIPLAEQHGWIQQITQNALNTGIRQLSHWQQAGLDCTLAINLSIKDFNNHDLVNNISELISNHPIQANSLIIELTESTAMTNYQQVHKMLKQLNTLGITIAVDDFGTGYSSLSHLRKMPVELIKIDQSFISDMIDDENDAVIVRSTIDLAHNMGKKVVAEGVRNKDIADILFILGCDYVQGFYYSEALPATEIPDWIEMFNRTADATPILTERRRPNS